MTFDRLQQIAMGELGMNESEFLFATLRTIFNVRKGRIETEERQERQAWERTRWQTWVLLNIHLSKKDKISSPQMLVLFPYEKEEQATPEISEEQRKILKAKSDRWVKRNLHKLKELNGTPGT